MMAAVANPTIEQFIFYARKLDGDDTETISRRYQLFVEELQSAYDHLCTLSERNPPTLSLPEFTLQRHMNQRIAHTGWIGADALKFSLEARAHGDAFYLQMAYHSARGRADSYAYLKLALWRSRAIDGLLGQSVYLHGLASQDLDTFVHEIFCQYTGQNYKEPLQAFCSCFPWGKLYELESRPYLLVLLYTAEGKEQARILLDRVIPRLELYRHIAQRQGEIYEQEIRPAIEEMEEEVRNAKSEARRPTSDLRLLEEQLPRVIALSQDYSGLLSKIEGCRTTIAMSRRNIEAILRRSPADWDDGVFHHYLQWIQFQEDQIQADLNFYRGERRDLAVTRQAIKIKVNLARGQEEKRQSRQTDRLFWLLGLLSLIFAIMDAVDAEPKVMVVKTVVALLLTAIFLVCYWFFRKRLSQPNV